MDEIFGEVVGGPRNNELGFVGDPDPGNPGFLDSEHHPDLENS